MKVITTIFTVCLFATFAGADEDCPLKGKWKSNEKATLEQMEKYGNVTDKQRKIFTNNMFGKLVIEATCTEATSYFEGSTNTANYRITKREGNILEMQAYDNQSKETDIKKIRLDGDCFYLPIGSLTFSEVFCRVK